MYKYIIWTDTSGESRSFSPPAPHPVLCCQITGKRTPCSRPQEDPPIPQVLELSEALATAKEAAEAERTAKRAALQRAADAEGRVRAVEACAGAPAPRGWGRF